jgi:SAM-dependent methyltransferase
MNKEQYEILNRLEKNYWWFCAKRNYISKYLPKPNGKWKILDLGSGTGGTSKFMEKWGRVDRIEQSEYAHKFLDLKKLKYKKGDIGSIRLKKNYYDLVCLFDVLYHRNIKQPSKILEKAYAALKTNGFLILTDSAFPEFSSHHDVLMHGARRFKLKGLTGNLEKAGFKVIMQSYIYFLLFPLFIVERLLNKYIQFNTMTEIYPFINKNLYKICFLESLFLKYVSYPVGSSVIIKAQKQ